MNCIMNMWERGDEFVHYLELDEKQVLLLGVSKEILIKVFGEPSVTFAYQGKEIPHYGHSAVFIFV